MAEPLNKAQRCVRRRAAILLGAGVFALPLSAWSLNDPTRPPDAIARMQEGAAPVPTGGPVLQSVILGKGRAEAIISGQRVKLGGAFEDARVVKITEDEVVLRRDQGLETLKLFPGVEKRMTKRGGATQAGKPARDK